MGFKVSSIASPSFNSDKSCKLLDTYYSIVDAEINSGGQVKSKSFAPSSFRCKRLNWFRLRGVETDRISVPDRGLDFTAKMGEACHHLIQSRLSTSDIWVNAESYIKSVLPDSEVTHNGYECQVSISDPPVNFACDGILKMNEEVILLEIKSCDHSTFEDMSSPKPYHIDQVKCYGTLLKIRKVLFMYMDRQYGGIKCYEYTITDADMGQVRSTFKIVIDSVASNIAPEGLPKGDRNCTSNMCPYFNKCKEWGR